MMELILPKVAFGIGAGLTRALVGYMKNSNEEEFDITKFAQTGFIGAIVGGGIYGSGIELDDTSLFTMVFTGTIVIDEIFKFFVTKYQISE